MSEIDLGHGHWLRWAGWHPDRELNPQYADLPDIEQCTAIIRHELLPGDDLVSCQERGYCEAAVTPDTPATRRLFSSQAMWNVASWEPLTLSPSLLCHCGDHGFIIDGRWVPA